MKNLLIISILVFLFVNVQAQTGQLILNTNVTGLLEQEKTIWLGTERFLTTNMSASFDLGYVVGEQPKFTLTPSLPLDMSKANLKLELGFKRYIGAKQHFYHGANVGFKNLYFADDVTVVKEWEVEEVNYNSGSIILDITASIIMGDKIYTAIEEDIRQEINQTQWSLQYMGGYTYRFNKINLDVFYQLGVEGTQNNITKGYRTALHPDDKSFEKQNNGLTKYIKADLDFGIKIGYLLN